MTNTRTLKLVLSTAFLFMYTVIISGCGGGTDAHYDVTEEPAQGTGQDPSAGLTANPELESSDSHSAEIEDALVDLEGLPLPAGVDQQLFSELKTELRKLLLQRSVNRISSVAPNGEVNCVTDLAFSHDQPGDNSLVWVYRNIGDYNQDGMVNVSDITPIGVHFGAKTGDLDWDNAVVADGNFDGTISVSDITPIGQNYLAFISGFTVQSSESGDGPWKAIQSFSRSEVFDGSTRQCTADLITEEVLYYRITPFDADTNEGEPSIAVSLTITSPALEEGQGGYWGEPWRTYLGEFQNVKCYSNSDEGKPSKSERTGNWGLRYECVEYCCRYTDAIWGFTFVRYKDACDFWAAAGNDSRVNRYANASSEPPRTGDIIVWGHGSGDNYGHVAIISEVPSGPQSQWTWIKVTEQNVTNTSTDVNRIIGLDPGYNVDVSDRWGYPTLGWIRPQNASPSDPPQPPIDVHASFGDDDFPLGINIDWTAPASGPNPTSYNVRRECVTGNDPNGSRTFDDVQVTFVDYWVIPGSHVKYQYYVSSNYPGHEPSAETPAEELGWAYMDTPDELEAPLSLAATDGTYTDKVRVTWSHPSSGETPDGYKVYRNGSHQGSVSYPTTQYDDTAATPGTTYTYYAISNKSGFSDSEPSNSDTGYASAPSMLNPPTGLAATDGTYNDRVRVTWSHPSTGEMPDGYKVYRDDSYLGSVSYSTSQYDDTTATQGTTYAYHATSYKSGFSDSDPSNSDTGYASAPSVLNPPTGLAATDGTYTDKVRVTWSHPSSGETPAGYKIYRNSSYQGSVSYPTTQYDDTSATQGTTYTYYATSYKSDFSDSDPSNSDTGYASAPSVLNPPTGLAATDGTYTDKVRVTWSHPSSGETPDGYKVFRNGSYQGSVSYSTTQYDDTSATQGTTYTYYATSYKSGFSDSDPSNSDTGYASAPSVLNPPTGLAATDGTYTDKVRVTWTHPSTGETPAGYKIYRNSTYQGSVSYPVAQYDDTSATQGTTYTYYATSYKSGFSDSESSNSDSGYASAPSVLNPPTGLAATDGTYTDKVRVTWSHPSSGETPAGYKIYRNSSYQGSVSYPATQYDDTSVTQGTTYTYYATSYKSGFSESDPSNSDTGYAQSSGSEPSVTIVNPSNNGIVSCDSQPSAICTDPDGSITSVKFYVDNTLRDTQYNTYPILTLPASNSDDWYMWGAPTSAWDIGSETETTHTLKVVATDNDGLTGEQSISVTVDNSAYTSGTYLANMTYQSNGVLNLAPGQTGYVTVTYTNMGTACWFNYGSNPVRLASTSHNGAYTNPSDVTSDFWDTSWLKNNRIGVMDGDSNYFECPNGDSTTFTIPVHVPTNYPSGSYYLNWNLVLETVQWIYDDNGASYGNFFVQINVS